VPRDDTPSTKPLLDKLGVKPGMRVAVLGVDDESFRAELAARTPFWDDPQDANIVFLAANEPTDMAGWRRSRARSSATAPSGPSTAKARRPSVRTTSCAWAWSPGWWT
jgi:hypothetical protein